MSKKATIIAVAVLIAAAVIFGLILVNKGDGPVMGLTFSDKALADGSTGSGVYLTVNKEFNKYTEKANAEIPAGKDLYANISLVECPKGAEFNAKWITDGQTVKEEAKKLDTDRKGTISYLLEANKAKSGNYTLELYREGKKIFEHKFIIK
jgi:hypothetical protein